MSTAAVDLTYRYPFASNLSQRAGIPALSLATSRQSADAPSHFFEGRLVAPRAFGDLMLAVSNIVRSNFFKPLTPAMLDPVITASASMFRFEGFSGCCGAYVQVAIPPNAIDGAFVCRGTTNVDFNDPMRAALTRLSDRQEAALSVGADAVTLVQGSDKIVEKKVKLPSRWIRSFCESHIYQGRLKPFATLDAQQTRQFMQETPRAAPRRPLFLESRAGGARWSTSALKGSIRIGGAHRVSILEPLTRQPARLEIWADESSCVTGWVVENASGRLLMMLSPEVERGFSGEGQALEGLADVDAYNRITLIRAQLKWQDQLALGELSHNSGVAEAEIRRLLSVLGTQGVVGFDLAAQSYFHRELPYAQDDIEKFQGRLRGARGLKDSSGVTLVAESEQERVFEVRSEESVYRVTIQGEESRCTCPWYGKHRGQRGPCKHVLAVRLQDSGHDA